MAVRVITGLADRIVRDDHNHKILGTVIGQLVCLAWLENERIAGLDFGKAIVVPHDSLAGNDMVKFPLRTVGVKWTHAFARRNPADFNVERMPLQ